MRRSRTFFDLIRCFRGQGQGSEYTTDEPEREIEHSLLDQSSSHTRSNQPYDKGGQEATTLRFSL